MGWLFWVVLEVVAFVISFFVGSMFLCIRSFWEELFDYLIPFVIINLVGVFWYYDSQINVLVGVGVVVGFAILFGFGKRFVMKLEDARIDEQDEQVKRQSDLFCVCSHKGCDHDSSEGFCLVRPICSCTTLRVKKE